MSGRFCFYCAEFKPVEEFSDEHILPHSLVKATQCPPPFRTDHVCKKCNETSGHSVDAFYLRSYFFLNDVALAAYKQIDFANPKPVPLVYHGILTGINFPNDMECELWQGPAGCRMYHIHRYKIPDEYRVMAGGHPIQRRKEPGTVYLVNSSDNNQWIQLTLASMKVAFPKSRRVPINLGFDDLTAKHFGLQLPNELDKKVIQALEGFGLDQIHKLQASMLMDFDFRCMAKIALGVGCVLFGEDYYQSRTAQLLRTAMWARYAKDREGLEVRGRSYFAGSQDTKFANILGWPTGFTITLSPTSIGAMKGLLLTLTMFGKKSMSIAITDEYERFYTPAIGAHGLVSILIPQQQFWHGPISVENFAAYKVGSFKIPKLDAAKAWDMDTSKYPPKRSTEGSSAP